MNKIITGCSEQSQPFILGINGPNLKQTLPVRAQHTAVALLTVMSSDPQNHNTLIQ